MMKLNASDERRALIIGGSLGGLFAGNLLRQIGWDVDIFERSVHDLDSRGGGVVLQPEVIEVFRRAGLDIRTVDLGVRSKYRTVFQPDGSIESPQTQTSWSLVYTTLKAASGDRDYHQATVATAAIWEGCRSKFPVTSTLRCVRFGSGTSICLVRHLVGGIT